MRDNIYRTPNASYAAVVQQNQNLTTHSAYSHSSGSDLSSSFSVNFDNYQQSFPTARGNGGGGGGSPSTEDWIAIGAVPVRSSLWVGVAYAAFGDIRRFPGGDMA